MASTVGTSIPSSVAGTDAQEIRDEIQQDLANSNASSVGLTSGTNPQNVKKDIQQDLNS